MVISSVAEMGLADEQISTVHRMGLDSVLTAVRRAGRLTSHLLALSSQFPGGAAEVFHLEEAFCALSPTLQLAIGGEVELRLELSPGLGHIKMDPEAFQQLLLQLATNACDAMKGKGTLLISATSEGPGDLVRILVRDNGPGIPAAILEKIFDPFFTTKAEAGSGLGLAVCWGLVEQAGGSLSVKSTGPEGTSVEVRLPRAKFGSTRAQVPAQAPVKAAPTAGVHILVVDDEPTVRRMVVQLLERLGYTSDAVGSGAEALGLIAGGRRYHLVVSDLLMPTMDGLELARRLRQSHPMLPILMMTGYSPDHEALREIPRAALLSKPFKLAQLNEAIHHALTEREQSAPESELI
jgi:CheY-like chemotaxis protein